MRSIRSKPNRWPPSTLLFGIERLDDATQVSPWDNFFHLIEKLLPARWLAETFKTFIGEGLLAHSTCLQAA